MNIHARNNRLDKLQSVEYVRVIMLTLLGKAGLQGTRGLCPSWVRIPSWSCL